MLVKSLNLILLIFYDEIILMPSLLWQIYKNSFLFIA